MNNDPFSSLGFGEQELIEIAPGAKIRPGYGAGPGLVQAAREVVAPFTSERIATVLGAPADIIHTAGGPNQGKVENLLHEYAGSEGIKKRVTEPIREKVFGQADEQSKATQVARRFGQLSSFTSPVKATLGTIGGIAAKEAGFGPTGQAIAEATGTLTPNALNAAKNVIKSTVKGAPKLLPSGLPQPRAMTSKTSKFASLPKEIQTQKIDSLNKEAGKLAKGTLEKHAPIIKDIEKGVDFHGQFEKDFGRVEHLAKKHNPEIDLTPLSEMMRAKRKDLQGIPKLSSQSIKIKNELKAFSKNPPTNAYPLLKTYRENNKKLAKEYERAKIFGKDKDYVDFLTEYNRNILSSIEKTLPADSEFVNLLKSSNKEYSNYIKGLEAKAILKPFFGDNITLGKLDKFASDPRLIKKMSLNIGKQGAQEISQIASDLKAARQSISKIPVKEVKKFEELLPAGYYIADFIPFGGKALKGYTAAKYLQTRLPRAYGHYLSNPATRRTYGNVLRSFIDNDPKAFGVATKRLIDEMERPESLENIGFTETLEDLGF